MIALAVVTAMAIPAWAQTTASPPGTDSPTDKTAGEGKSGVAAGSVLVNPGQGGVAGTGLGKMPAGDTTGTGMSVKGPAGQGVDLGQKAP